ncbi:Signal peptide peptidase-like 2 [Platanthera guangdongensis]|uniref:Signal peptide peptidase-like 2 n=1 Tax=Platanthera guangdongensis TaxID=2320717 RepID=A0ABR2M7K3_9ASPA
MLQIAAKYRWDCGLQIDIETERDIWLIPGSLKRLVDGSEKLTEVKVKNWFNGVESPEIVGISAKFGATLPRHLSEAVKGPAVLTSPVTSCGKLSRKLSNSIALAIRGDCDFTDKAKVAESAGAAGLMVINDDEELSEMACTGNESAISITIPVIMIPKSAGDNIRKSLTNDGRMVSVASIFASPHFADTMTILIYATMKSFVRGPKWMVACITGPTASPTLLMIANNSSLSDDD